MRVDEQSDAGEPPSHGVTYEFRTPLRWQRNRPRNSRARADLVRGWTGVRLVLVGLRPDPAALARVQPDESIDITNDPRPYEHARPVRYLDVHLTALALAGVGSVLARQAFGSQMDVGLLFLPMLLIAWAVVWLYRKSRVSANPFTIPLQLVSTVIEPRRVERTVLGVTRTYEYDDSLLVIRPYKINAHGLKNDRPDLISVQVTLLNGSGQRSGFRLNGLDHPTLADLIARWQPRLSATPLRAPSDDLPS